MGSLHMSGVDAKEPLYAFGSDESTYIVAGDATQRVACGGVHQQYPGIDACGKESYHDGLAAEGEYATRKESGDKHTPRTIVGQKVEKLFHRHSEAMSPQRSNNTMNQMFLPRLGVPVKSVEPMDAASSAMMGCSTL